LDCVIGRRDIIIQLPPSSLAKLIIFKPNKALWMCIRASEQRMGRQLVVREGRGSRLTPYAENLMKQFKRLRMIVLTESDELYDSMMSDHFTG
jgi:DNA-binding transcriptional LysR family regulator